MALCLYCKSAETQENATTFCGRSCARSWAIQHPRRSAPRASGKCLACGRTWKSNYPKKFCGKSCAATYRWKQHQEVQPLKYCRQCNAELRYDTSHDLQFCSLACSTDSKRTERPLCASCGKRRVTGMHNKFCSHSCAGTKNIPKLRLLGVPELCLYRGIQMRSTFEVKLAEFLDAAGIAYEYEPRVFRGKANGKRWSYTPDFYLPAYDKYVEVKSSYTWELSRDRLLKVFNRLRARGTQIKMITETHLKRMKTESPLVVLKLS